MEVIINGIKYIPDVREVNKSNNCSSNLVSSCRTCERQINKGFHNYCALHIDRYVECLKNNRKYYKKTLGGRIVDLHGVILPEPIYPHKIWF